jgi:hypothetical protein
MAAEADGPDTPGPGTDEENSHPSNLVDQSATDDLIAGVANDDADNSQPLDVPVGPRRLGFLLGQAFVPDDFDSMCQAEIIALFGGDE